MKRTKLCIAAAAVAAVTVLPAAPARAGQMCNAEDPLVEQVVCGTYGLAGGLVCKITKGQSCIT